VIPRDQAKHEAFVTPVEVHDGITLKRDDLHKLPCGVNGTKLRGIQALFRRAQDNGYKRVISAASVLSPQNPNAAAAAAELGMGCTVILGGTKPETATRHPGVRIAAEQGATFEYIPIGYNPALQRAAAKAAAADPGAYLLHYGGPPADDVAEVHAYHAAGADQTSNLPDSTKTLVIPFGSGTSAATILLGLSYGAPASLERIILVGIGPDRQGWLHDRLRLLTIKPPVPLEHIALHPHFATYGDKMKASIGNVVLHPTYEAKAACWANENRPGWWTVRDGSTCFWVVGAELP
jgi:hypothetical protein